MNLEQMKCNVCGAPLDINELHNGVLKCEACGTIWAVPNLPQKRLEDFLTSLEAGYKSLDVCKFDDAYTHFRNAAEIQKQPDAYFGMALATFKVQYLRDEVDNAHDGCKNFRFQPICHEISKKVFTEDSNYKTALELASSEQQEIYREKGEEIDYIRKQFYEIERTGLQYDCFICTKVTDDTTKQPTEDSKAAGQIYQLLLEKGYKPFYSECALRNMAGADYEARILYALFQSECMLVVCRKEDYLMTPWVKNEYTRFLKLVNDEEKENDSIAIVFNGTSIERLPGRNGKLQGIDFAHRESANEEIVNFVERHNPEAKRRREEEEKKKKVEEEARQQKVDKLQQQVNEILRRESEPQEITQRPEKRRKWVVPSVILAVVIFAIAGVFALWRPLEKLFTNTPDNPGEVTDIPGENPGNTPGGETDVTPGENPGNTPGGETDVTPGENPDNTPGEDDLVSKFDFDAFSVKVNDDGESVTVSIKLLKDTIDIPSEISYENKRYKVTAIGYAEMMDNDGVEAVNLPNGIERIGDGAFSNFTSLKKISIPDSVQSIGNAFGGCSELAIVNVNSLKMWCSIGFEGENANPLSALESSVLYVGNKPIAGEVSLSSDITRIPDYTFRNSSVEIVRIPDSVKEIGKDVFVNCKKLSKAVLSASLEAIPEGTFFGCGNMTSITVPFVGGYLEPQKGDPSHVFGYIFGKKEYEGSFAIKQWYMDLEGFDELCELQSASDPIDSQGIYEKTSEFLGKMYDEVTDELNNTMDFYIPHELREIEVLKGKIPDGAFSIMNDYWDGEFSLENQFIFGKILLGDDISSIGAMSFRGCINLKSIKFPQKTNRIGSGAFWFSGLSGSLIIPDSVRYIGGGAFAECEIEEVYFGDGVEYIGGAAFMYTGYDGEPPAMKVVFGKNISRVGGQCFDRPIKGVYISDLEAWCNIQFDSYIYYSNYYSFSSTAASSNPLVEGGHLWLNGTLLTEVEIPNGTKELVGTFMGAKDIKKVVIPDTVTRIGHFSFYKCSALTEITIPKSVTEIGEGAFYDCSSLDSVSFENKSGWKEGDENFDVSDPKNNASLLKKWSSVLKRGE